MAALELPKYEHPPMHTFETRQMMRRNEEGELVLAYVLVPKKVEGQIQMHDVPAPGGQGFMKVPVLVEDLEQPISEDFIKIRPHGSKDEYEMIAEQFVTQCERQARMAEPLFPMAWALTMRTNYENWKTGKEPILEGIDIMLWTAIPKAQREFLVRAGFPTVEQIAAANEQALQQIGVGARQIKNRAIEFLAKTKSSDAIALKKKVDEQAETIAKLLAAVEKLTGKADPVEDFVQKQMKKKAGRPKKVAAASVTQ